MMSIVANDSMNYLLDVSIAYVFICQQQKGSLSNIELLEIYITVKMYSLIKWQMTSSIIFHFAN